MSRKEGDFDQQLDKALRDKQGAIQQLAAEERLRQQQAEVRAGWQAREESVRERQKNQKLLEIESQFPIMQYLNKLRDKIAPREKVERWGPENGEIAYAFSFGLKIKKIIDIEGGTFHSRSDYPKAAGHSFSYYVQEESHLEIQKEVFGVKLHDRKKGDFFYPSASIYNETIRHKIPWGILTPFVLNPHSHFSCGWGKYEPTIGKDIYLDTSEGPQQFKQALANFYATFKVGSGK